MEYCNDHSNVMQQLGRMEERQVTMAGDIGDMKLDLRTLVQSGVEHKAQWAPAKWIAGSILAAVILVAVTRAAQLLGWVK
jgi:hypothetical protein